MGDYTPNTEQVRSDFAQLGDPAAFDRWLATHDAEVKAEALREFARKWTAWIITDAPQVRGGAAYRANAEADVIARGDQP